MTKKMKKKRRLKLIPAFLFLLIIGGICFFSMNYLNSSIQNIVVKNNRYLKEEEIIQIAKLEEYPSFYLTSSFSIERRLKSSPYIKSVSVEKSFYHKVTLNIQEYRILFQNETTGKVVLENKEEVDKPSNLREVPSLMNYVPDEKYDSFIKAMKRVDEKVVANISEIKYTPNEYDKDRFLLYMDDGNSVYLTLTKFKMINYYDEVLPQLEGKKGILYLDSGNHFQIME